MSESYVEIVLAPTGRATCKKTKEKIDAGTLKWVMWYTPKGRNHMESAGYMLCNASQKTVDRVVKDLGGKIECIRGFNALPEAAQAVAKRLLEAILNGTSIEQADVDFRCVPEKKPRDAKRKRNGYDESRSFFEEVVSIAESSIVCRIMTEEERTALRSHLNKVNRQVFEMEEAVFDGLLDKKLMEGFRIGNAPVVWGAFVTMQQDGKTLSLEAMLDFVMKHSRSVITKHA